jgi:thiamine kinase-like enzyme
METADSVRAYIEINALFAESKLKDIIALSGGLVNYVYRLVFENNTSYVLKYFPRFLASNRTVEMSQNRYFIEKCALTELQNQPWLKESPHSMIRTPKVVHFDDENFTLIMEDAGTSCKTLFTLLTNESNQLYNDELLSQIAKEVKIFSSYLSDKSNIRPKTHKELENKSAWDIIGGYVKSLCFEQAKTYNLEAQVDSYLQKLDRLFKPLDNSDEAVFVFGDLWPNSILVDVEKKLIWIIDWEMARFETRIRDMAQLMANLWVMKENDKLFNVHRIETLMRKLQLEFLGDENLDWRFNSDDITKDEFLIWILVLIREKHWEIEENQKRSSILKALDQIEQK